MLETIKMKSWKTTLGGALSAFGTTLMGVGVVPQLSGTKSDLLYYIALVGFLTTAAGQFFSGLYARDNDKSSEDVKIK